MNRSPQLQFNLESRTDYKNLATHFDPDAQPPVIIKKLGNVETVGLSRTPRDAFRAVNPDRLALAVELAKRKVQRARRSYSEVVTPGSEDIVKKPKTPPEPVSGQFYSEKQADIKTEKGYSRGRDVKSSRPGKLGRGMVDEIGSLNAELQKQLLQLSEVHSRKMADTSKKWSRQNVGPRYANRRRWEEEEEEEDEQSREKLEQWKKEQQSRNSRMMYDLSQQIKDLEKKINRTQQYDSGISQQNEVVKKLAAAQRAALRTLQTFGGPKGRASNSIPPELSLLIQQLALLSTQLGGAMGGANSEITASVLQLVKTMEERQKVARLLMKQEQEVKGQGTDNGVPSSTPLTQMKKKDRAPHRLPLRMGVLLDPHLQKKRAKSQVIPKKTHYTQGTFNSLRRQQPPVEHGVSFSSPSQLQCSVLNSSILRPCQIALSSSPTQDDRRPKKTKKGMKSLKVPVSSAPCNDNKTEQDNQEKLSVCEEEGLNGGSVDGTSNAPHDAALANQQPAPSEPATTNLTSVIAQQNDQLELLRSEISQKLTELGAVFGSREFANADPQVKSMANTPAIAPGMADGGLSQMLRRLDELEAEENEIGKRWTSVVYEDLGSRRARRRHSTEKRDDPLNATPTLTCAASTLDKDSLYGYKERYSRYLDCTGLSTGGGFNPWHMAERIADDMLDELVEGVAGEVGQVCDGCVENLYNSEFLRPP